MIISVSRRTDIPAFYGEWFTTRLREGFALAVNPMNPRQVRRVPLLPDQVDGLVLWSKNPRPLLSALDVLSDYPYYLQFTLNAYGYEVEPGLPPLQERVDTLFRWADAIGPERVIWRYDPILLSDRYPAEFHVDHMEKLAGALSSATRQVTISFLDDYAKTRRRMATLGARCPSQQEILELAPQLAAITQAHGLRIATCAEPLDLSVYGIVRARCVDATLLGGKTSDTKPDPNQRPACGCAPSVDIGAYNCCAHRCAYCYANAGAAVVERNMARHDPMGEALLG
ncbi:MAG: DUF1848 domain-containing protein [Clostridia bacterium]|nr:DUF1848 domain-containing protein [Clostridia bacterium]